MSKLRGNPKKHTCQQFLDEERGVCGDPAVYRCNACREYFCLECWIDHLEMSMVMEDGVVSQKQSNSHGLVSSVK
jgi:hypothetical protein